MTTFDQILPKLAHLFRQDQDRVARLSPILINRDLNGRVRLLVDQRWKSDPEARLVLDAVAHGLQMTLDAHAYPAEQTLLFEPNLDTSLKFETTFPLEGIPGIHVVDRLATEGNWASIATSSTTVPRIVFFSIKGGVGRSTAMAATAWSLAESGKRVLVLDLDLESPGLSSALLPEDRRPLFGIADWLVEDLVNNGAAVFNDMVATSALSHNGEILVVPAHGADAGEYIAKLGRVWMAKINGDGGRESWEQRLQRLLDALEQRWAPDVTLIDSRAGIDEVASACLTSLAATTILLFAIDGDQTWSGYRILFRHWRMSGVVGDIRERLQIVGAMIPEIDTVNYLEGLRERAWVTFAEELYDEVPAGAIATEGQIWSFDETDEGAPHFPWAVRWHRGYAALKSLHGRFMDVAPEEVDAIFGPMIRGLMPSIELERGES